MFWGLFFLFSRLLKQIQEMFEFFCWSAWVLLEKEGVVLGSVEGGWVEPRPGSMTRKVS